MVRPSISCLAEPHASPLREHTQVSSSQSTSRAAPKGWRRSSQASRVEACAYSACPSLSSRLKGPCAAMAGSSSCSTGASAGQPGASCCEKRCGKRCGKRSRNCCKSQQKARSLSVVPTGITLPSSGGWKFSRLPLWQNSQCRPRHSRWKGWQLASPTAPCVALRTWASTVRARIGCERRKSASGASQARPASMKTRQPSGSWKPMPQPSTWWPVWPPRREKPLNENVAAVGALPLRAKSSHIQSMRT